MVCFGYVIMMVAELLQDIESTLCLFVCVCVCVCGPVEQSMWGHFLGAPQLKMLCLWAVRGVKVKLRVRG